MAATTTNGIEPPPKLYLLLVPHSFLGMSGDHCLRPFVMLETLMISLTRNKKLFSLIDLVQRARKDSKLPDATHPQGATEYTKVLLKDRQQWIRRV